MLAVDGEGSAAAIPSASPADSKKKEKKAKADAAGKYEFEVHTAARHYRFQANSDSEMYARVVFAQRSSSSDVRAVIERLMGG